MESLHLRDITYFRGSHTMLFSLFFVKCVPFRHGNSEQCSEMSLGPAGSVLHLGLFAYRGFANVKVLCFEYDGNRGN